NVSCLSGTGNADKSKATVCARCHESVLWKFPPCSILISTIG
ncbi:hypothetical protein X975_03212, partial [Stegodyphus mimosarum]